MVIANLDLMLHARVCNAYDLESQVRILLPDSYFTNMLVQQVLQITELKF